MNKKYYYGQDGEVADENLIKLFGLGTKELRYSKNLNANLFDVVGFFYNQSQILVVFPKHYYDKLDIDKFNENNIRLPEDISRLYRVIQKYSKSHNTTANALSFLGAKVGYDSDYPFEPFYEVYDYYQKFGLYKETEMRVVEGNSGKIMWKDIIRKSNKIISGGNLIFTPFYAKKNNFNDVFLTECMSFIIDYTIDFFSDFICLKKIGKKIKFDFLNNIDYVVNQLNVSLGTVFKDTQKQLIQSMLNFFEQFRKNAKGGNIHVRIGYFNMIWQDMIAEYLNCHFSGIDVSSGSAIFDKTIQKSAVEFAETTFSDIDDSYHNFEISIDHFAYLNNVLYIFDSKYYSDIMKLNYKQLSYNEILRYHFTNVTEINNILLLPGEENANVHFSFAPGYVGGRKMGTKIIEQFLPPRQVMEDYLDTEL